MAIVSEYAKMRIKEMERDELLRTYGKLRRYLWPEELGPRPWIWGRGEVFRHSAGFRHIYHCTEKVRDDYMDAVARELGEREIDRIEEEAGFIGGRQKYFLI